MNRYVVLLLLLPGLMYGWYKLVANKRGFDASDNFKLSGHARPDAFSRESIPEELPLSSLLLESPPWSP